MTDYRDRAIKDYLKEVVGFKENQMIPEDYVLVEKNAARNKGIAYLLAQREARLRLEDALRWANGEGEDFPERQPGQGAYWWRTELMKRAALEG